MDRERLEAHLEGIRHLLSHLHGEVTHLEESYHQVLLVLRRIEGSATTDELSGLLRRGPFFRKWHALVEECRKLGESCGILLVDIDHFKRVNDVHGHPTGDEVIRRVGGLLRQFESPRCFAARYGGEEFAVGFRGSDAQTMGLAELVRRGAERLHGPVIGPDGRPLPKIQWRCTVSLGVATSSREGHEPSRMILCADRALYRAKRTGRNRVKAA